MNNLRFLIEKLFLAAERGFISHGWETDNIVLDFTECWWELREILLALIARFNSVREVISNLGVFLSIAWITNGRDSRPSDWSVKEFLEEATTNAEDNPSKWTNCDGTDSWQSVTFFLQIVSDVCKENRSKVKDYTKSSKISLSIVDLRCVSFIVLT